MRISGVRRPDQGNERTTSLFGQSPYRRRGMGRDCEQRRKQRGCRSKLPTECRENMPNRAIGDFPTRTVKGTESDVQERGHIKDWGSHLLSCQLVCLPLNGCVRRHGFRMPSTRRISIRSVKASDTIGRTQEWAVDCLKAIHASRQLVTEAMPPPTRSSECDWPGHMCTCRSVSRRRGCGVVGLRSCEGREWRPEI
ncbi:unnamed protein product [Protopolystoma xenopodis]|uniref:Uncharacterized protein n=1 Tax=Protopolystoma xenopodis TaxID=117903 RepID=A0A3S5BIS8_9PLAT|nr:unnamed protein product [Protopolystoma xenopodis]